MAQQAYAGGNSLTHLALLAVAIGIVALIIRNPATQQWLQGLTKSFKANPLYRFFYGTAQVADESTEDSTSPAPAEPEDNFDYSIFAQPDEGSKE